MLGFSWIIDERLAGLPRPGVRVSLEDDLRFLQQQGIRLLVSLTESSVDPDLAARFDISIQHLPIRDFSPPTLNQMQAFANEVHSVITSGQAAAAHCAAGMGRTGTMLAAYLIATGVQPKEAIKTIRTKRPGSIETVDQEQALYDFDQWLKENGASLASR